MIVEELNTMETVVNNTEAFDDEIIPDADRVILGLRDTGYDFNTAIADIIDNSIAAKATNVDVSINVTPKGEILIYISDNGIGMNQQELRNAMKYGSAERVNKKSLGKFGLGLKTASTAFCRKMSLISRGSDGIVRKIQWDLDYIAKVNRWKPITMEPTKSEIKILESVAADGTGTVVVWEKVDRLLAKGLDEYSGKTAINNAIKTKKEKLRYHLGVTFQRFLDTADTRCPNISISVDMVPVNAIDPFCTKESETIKYPLPKPLMIKVDENEKHPVTIFYVYRENRLIHYGDWLGMFSNEPHYSLLRVEFSFGAELDNAFNVDIKKSRILPAEEIIDWIKNTFISAPRREANDRYRVGKTKQIIEGAEKVDAHASSNRNIESKAATTEESQMTPIGKDTALLKNANGSFNHKIEILSATKPGEVRIIPVEDLEYGNLWKPCLTEDEKHAIKLNQKHPFYQKVYSLILEQNVMVNAIDALFWALAEAENSTVNAATEEYYEDMRTSVSRQLKKLLADLPDPEDTDS